MPSRKVWYKLFQVIEKDRQPQSVSVEDDVNNDVDDLKNRIQAVRNLPKIIDVAYLSVFRSLDTYTTGQMLSPGLSLAGLGSDCENPLIVVYDISPTPEEPTAKKPKFDGIQQAEHYTAFFAALKAAALIKKRETTKAALQGVLECNFEGFIASKLEIKGFEKVQTIKFLCRQEYWTLKENIMAHYKDRNPTSSKAVVCGTAGIGQSAFRYYIILLWLLDDIDLPCEKIYFNLGESFFLIDKAGVVIPAPKNFHDISVVALLDPCIRLQAREQCFLLLIITTSPSPLVGQDKQCDLSQVSSDAKIFVMLPWVVEEFELLDIPIDDVQLSKLSYFEGGIQCCVPRWLFIPSGDLNGKLNSSLRSDSRKALYEFFTESSPTAVKDMRLPYKLCVISAAPHGNDFVATRLISNYVTEKALLWAAAGAVVERTRLVSLITNPFSQGLMGTWFENWAFRAMTTGKKSLHSVGKSFSFGSLEQFDGLPESAGSRRVVTITPGVLYQAKNPSCPSIDGFGMVNGDLVMVQMTVGREHSAAEWTHINYIYNTAKKIKKDLQAYLVYVVPDAGAFTLPKCSSLDGKATIGVGTVDDNFYEPLKKKVEGNVTTAIPDDSSTRRRIRLKASPGSSGGAPVPNTSGR